MTDLSEESEYFTVENLHRLERDHRAQCGCEPICPDCREIRDVNDVTIRVMLKAGAHSVGEISYLCPDPEKSGHLSGVGPWIEVTSAFVGY